MCDVLQDFTLLRQGAEGKLMVGRFLGEKAIAKIRFKKNYRHPALDQQLTRDRLKSEVRSLNRCKLLGVKTPTIFFADFETSTIIMEYLENTETARDFIRKLSNESSEENKEKLRQTGVTIGSILAKLHANKIIHGDLTTSNILVEDNDPTKLVMIDFGLGFSEGSPEDMGVDIYVLERALLSTHPNSEWLFQVILTSYKSELKRSCSNMSEIVKKFEEIRMRGRKRTMVG